MNEYVIDARLLHSRTLAYLKEGNFKRLICVSERVTEDELQQRLLNNLPDLPIPCIFTPVFEYETEEDENKLVIFESFACLKSCLCEDIKEVTVIYVSTWGKPANYYGEGLYLSGEEKAIIAELLKSERKLYYRPQVGSAKRLLSEIMESADVD